MSSEVKVFILDNGAEIVAKVTEQTSEYCVLESPLMLIHTQNGPSFAPVSALGNTGKVVLKKWTMDMHPREEVRNTYLQATGSIVTPSTQIITK